MVTFKLIKIVNGYYYYEIYPQGDTTNPGRLVFNPETKDVKERVQPENSGDYDWVSKAVEGLSDDNGSYKDSGMVAWY